MTTFKTRVDYNIYQVKILNDGFRVLSPSI